MMVKQTGDHLPSSPNYITLLNILGDACYITPVCGVNASPGLKWAKHVMVARVTSLGHVSIIYMIELSDEQQSNIFWATEYQDKKNQQILLKELLQ